MKTFAQFYVVKALICLAGVVYLLLAHGQLSEVLCLSAAGAWPAVRGAALGWRVVNPRSSFI